MKMGFTDATPWPLGCAFGTSMPRAMLPTWPRTRSGWPISFKKRVQELTCWQTGTRGGMSTEDGILASAPTPIDHAVWRPSCGHAGCSEA